MTCKILVVDDSATARFMVSSALKQGGYQVIEAAHGEDGLAKLAEHPDVALVVADVNMPWKDGMEMLRDMRADKRFASTPVVFLTTEGNAEKISEARTLGAAGFLIKPMNPQNLLTVVKKIAG